MLKNGLRTSEFWLIVAVLAANALHTILESLGIHFTADANQTLLVAQGLAAVYAACRTLLKRTWPSLPTLPEMPAPVSLAPSAPSYAPVAPVLTPMPSPPTGTVIWSTTTTSAPVLTPASAPVADTPVQTMPVIESAPTSAT